MKEDRFSYFLPPIGNTIPDRLLSLESIWEYISGRKDLEVRRRTKTGGYLNLGSLQSVTELVRSLSPEVYSSREKGKLQYLPLVTFGGSFSQRRGDGLKDTSGFVNLDIDHISRLGGVSLEELKDRLSQDREIGLRLLFTSPSGDGLKIVCKTSGEIKDPESYRREFETLQYFVSQKYSLPIGEVGLDKGISDITRGCLLCYDPGAILRDWEDTFNPEKHPLPKEESPRPKPERREVSVLETDWDLSRKWGEFTEGRLIPAMFERIDSVFPDMDFHYRGSTWESPYKLDGNPAKDPRREKSVITSRVKGVILEQGGDRVPVIDYYMQKYSLSFGEALRELSRLCGLEEEYRVLSREYAQMKDRETMDRNTAPGDKPTSVPDKTSKEEKYSKYLVIQDYREELSKEVEGIKTDYLFRNSQGEEEYLTLPSETLTFICGQSSHGKTRYLENLALQVAGKTQEGESVLFFTFEESFKSIFLQSANIKTGVERLSQYGTKNPEVLRDYFTHKEEESWKPKSPDKVWTEALPRINEFESLYKTGRLRIYYTPDLHSGDLCDLLKWLSSRIRIKAVFIDYVQAMYKGVRIERREELREICKELKQTSVELQIPFVLSAQLNRDTPNPTSMSGDNIAESADINRYADLVVCLWNSAFINDVKDKDRYIDSKPEKELRERGFILGEEGKLYALLTKNRGGTPYLDSVLTFNGKTGEIPTNDDLPPDISPQRRKEERLTQGQFFED